MFKEEMAFATVANDSKNEAAGELYRTCVSEPWHELDDYSGENQ